MANMRCRAFSKASTLLNVSEVCYHTILKHFGIVNVIYEVLHNVLWNSISLILSMSLVYILFFNWSSWNL